MPSSGLCSYVLTATDAVFCMSTEGFSSAEQEELLLEAAVPASPIS
jgi:hypothetical protein